MALTAGTRLGPYQVQSPIGAGGMGEVYKATDTRLNRTVAIKVLPPHFAEDPEMRQRFNREAQTIAGLNHPNICTLHDVGEHNGTHYLVMEYVEGETLADRIARGPLSIAEALQVASEIADALDKAHRQGVVHRDLKPANVMLARSGGSRLATSPALTSVGTSAPSADPADKPPSGSSTVAARSSVSGSPRSGSAHTKLLDFGLAKFAATQGESLAARSTRMDVTTQGTILGTLQYMAPEQVEGKEADARTDLFAFGAVLYEMLTGKKAFEGKSQASLIGAIMKAEPRPISHAQPATPAVLEHLVARCLVKDPDERWQDAHSLLLKLRWITRNRGNAATVAPPARRARNIAIAAVALILVAALAVPAALYLRGEADPEPLQFRHTISGLSESDVALSPDGKTIAFVARPETQGAPSLYIRPAGGIASVKLAGTDNAEQPFWSPDSLWIAYLSGGKLKKVLASGGAPKDVCEAAAFSGGTWSADQGGTIVFGSTKGLYRVSAEGGQATLATELDQAETGHLWPNFLPDGRHFVYLGWSEEPGNRAVYLGTLDSKERTQLIDAESNAVYAAPGYLLFRRQATLFARPFDAGKRTFTGDPIQVAGEVSAAANGRGIFSVSQNGVLIYFQGAAGTGSTGRARTVLAQFGWTDSTGGQRVHALDSGSYGDMDLSPDGKRIAITRQDPGASRADIWVIDWEKAVPHRVTSDPADAVDPVWSPDNRRIAFTSWRKGNADIYVKNANGVGEETPLVESSANESVEDWSKDGKYIAYLCGQDAFQDICAVPLDGLTPGKPFPVVSGRYQKNEPQFSKDGQWLAYISDENEAGKFQVYVISFPAGDLKQQISTEGGGQPRWRWDGKELYYRTLDHRHMVVGLAPGKKIEATAPRELFRAPNTNPTAADPARHMWSVTSDGRFLLRVPPGSGVAGAAGSSVVTPFLTPAGQSAAATVSRSPTTSGLTAILHWTSVLKKAGQ